MRFHCIAQFGNNTHKQQVHHNKVQPGLIHTVLGASGVPAKPEISLQNRCFATTSLLLIPIASVSPFLSAGSETPDGCGFSGKNEGGKGPNATEAGIVIIAVSKKE